MKPSIQDKIKTTQKQLRLCSIIDLAAVILTILILIAEFAIAKFAGAAAWRGKVLGVCIYVLYVMPFAIVIPLFFRVNLKGKLYQLRRQLEEDNNQRKDD